MQDALKAEAHCITSADLPLCCPMPNTQIWDSHPRIYLPIEKIGYIACPYCGAQYSLKDEPHSTTQSL